MFTHQVIVLLDHLADTQGVDPSRLAELVVKIGETDRSWAPFTAVAP